MDEGFVITGYSLIDWVKHDTSLPAAARTPDEINRLYKEPWLKVCGDLATASKHYTLTRRTPLVTSAESQSGWGKGRYGKGGYGVGEEAIVVHINNDGEWTALSLLVASCRLGFTSSPGRLSVDTNAPRALDKRLRSDEAHRSHRVGED